MISALKKILNYKGVGYFIAKEVLSGCHRHNFLAFNASISFFTLFALIPLILLIFFFLSQWLTSSSFALSHLANLTSHLLPEMNERIMNEVYKVSSSKASWGALWIMVLFLAATPLTASLRNGFANILSLPSKNTFFKNKIKDIFAVITIMVLFFTYIFVDIFLLQASTIFAEYIPIVKKIYFSSVTSLILLMLVVMIFFNLYFPIKIKKIYLSMGALLTSLSWYSLSYFFDFFINASSFYGTFFGGMRGLFISLIWLYLNTASLLIGAELIAALHKKEILLLKQLFIIKHIHRYPVINDLMKLFGHRYKKNKVMFKEGDHDQRLFFIIEGEINITKKGEFIESINAGNYFGELSLLNNIPRVATAEVASDWTRIIIISEAQMKNILAEDHQVAIYFLSNMARKLQLN
ncbi:YihY/virulence factor BrkB family protein [Methylophilaceae bacterium]|jgi:membrane protein|nr:YihY/virulence factor BrkB family protein [Methylophilaceae bacterium]